MTTFLENLRRGARGAVLILIAIAIFAVPAEVYGADAEETAGYLLQTVPEPRFGSIGGEWGIIGISRAGISLPSNYISGYYEDLENVFTQNGGDLGRKYTEYARVALALNEIGYDVTNVAGYNLIYYLTDYDSVVRQGINGPIFALTALSECGHSQNEVIDRYVGYILERQHADGSFGLSDDGDADVTAMAIQALSYIDGRADVDSALEGATAYLSSIQNADGTFSADGAANCESTAQVLIAMSELGISLNDDRFVKNGNTVLDGLDRFYVSGGGYKHLTAQTEPDLMATEQALLALTSGYSERSIDVSKYDELWEEAQRQYNIAT